MAVSLEDLDRKLDRILYGQAQLSLRIQNLDSTERPALGAIKAEAERLLKDFQDRYNDDPPIEGIRVWQSF